MNRLFTIISLAVLSLFQQPITSNAGQTALPGHHVNSRGCTLWNDTTGSTSKKMILFDVGQTSVNVTMDKDVTGRALDIETGDTVTVASGCTITVTGNGGQVTIGTNAHVTITQYGSTPINYTLPNGTTGTITGGPVTFNT